VNNLQLFACSQAFHQSQVFDMQAVSFGNAGHRVSAPLLDQNEGLGASFSHGEFSTFSPFEDTCISQQNMVLPMFF